MNKKNKDDSLGKKGSYLGTEIDEKWWKRCSKYGLLARGSGTWGFEDESFFFLRHLTREPIRIPYREIREVKTGKWHSGRWCFGYPIMKIIWVKDGVTLSSGFLVSKKIDDVSELMADLRRKIEDHETVTQG